MIYVQVTRSAAVFLTPSQSVAILQASTAFRILQELMAVASVRIRHSATRLHVHAFSDYKRVFSCYKALPVHAETQP